MLHTRGTFIFRECIRCPQAAAANAHTAAKMALDRVSNKTKIDVFENAFRKIKEVNVRAAYAVSFQSVRFGGKLLTSILIGSVGLVKYR